jgi:hypothetical protein
MRPICTKENPAPPKGFVAGCNHSRDWNRDYQHPDATGEEINSDHGDMRYTCPNCNQSYVAEGPDS